MNRIVFFAILAFLFAEPAFSQKVDTNYIQRFPSYFIVSPYINTASAVLNLRPRFNLADTAAVREIDYAPNIKGGYGFDISYKVIDISVGFRQKLDPNTEFLYGRTSYSRIGFRLWASRNIMTEVKFQRYKGFSNRMTPSYDSDTVFHGDVSPYQYRPDIVLTYFKVRAIYQLNPYKFSMRSSFSFSERQRRRAGGWLVSAHIYSLNFSGDSALVPNRINKDFGENSGIKEIRTQAIGLSPGYGGTLTKGRFFITAIFFLGADFQHFSYYMPAQKKQVNEFRVVTMTDFRTSVGYNNKRLFFGIETTLDYNLLGLKKMHGSFSNRRVLFSFGYRFNSPKILDRSYQKIVDRYIPVKYRKAF